MDAAKVLLRGHESLPFAVEREAALRLPEPAGMAGQLSEMF